MGSTDARRWTSSSVILISWRTTCTASDFAPPMPLPLTLASPRTRPPGMSRGCVTCCRRPRRTDTCTCRARRPWPGGPSCFAPASKRWSRPCWTSSGEGTPSVLTLDRRSDPSDALRRAAEVQGLALAPGQLEAAHRALTCKISVLTGGPGTGKTSTLRTLIVALELMDVTYALCAPTGRAAKRVAETTERPASTIHRLLEYQPGIGIFGRDHINPLEADVVIVDEVSMLDAVLFYHLLKAVPPESHLLLVGDADQLPAVGPGSVLHELIVSERVPTTRLTDLFRQARGSNIIRAAHAINRGEVPEIGNAPTDDLFF